jgi:hypothetical protein
VVKQPEPDVDPAEIVPIRHPDLPESSPGRVTRAAYAEIWEAKGFEIVDNDGQFIKAAAKTPAGGASS